MNDWTTGYVYGEYQMLLDWLVSNYPSEDEDTLYHLDGTLSFIGPKLYPRRKYGTNTDEFGNESPNYVRIAARTDIICLVAFRAEGQLIVDAAIEAGLTVHIGVSRDEIAELYPAHALGQTIPYISEE